MGRALKVLLAVAVGAAAVVVGLAVVAVFSIESMPDDEMVLLEPGEEPVQVEVGKEVGAAVHENASIGDQWSVVEVEGVEESGTRYHPDAPETAGGGVELTFLFDVVEPGEGVVVLENCYRCGSADEERTQLRFPFVAVAG